MNRSAWERAKSLLAEAADLPASAREQFVRDRCPDPAMRREVLELLASPAALSDIVSAGALEPGAHLGAYVVERLLGRGGMGEVYEARDTSLNRRVAIKVLPTVFAGDPERVARFRREAQLLAVLNHPNIAQIYGFEESTGVSSLVMELVEGPTLADRLAHETIPLGQALAFARQIAAALAAAHERGIVHRDLKPANIKARDDGTVKVLDFGLAKALDLPALSTPHALSPPTHNLLATQAGQLLGTASYMAPEQALGKPLDKRADIWAFGCVLYELLTGRQAFAGATMSEVLAHIRERDPEWSALPPRTPKPVRRLLRHCLERDSERRLRDIGDARFDLDEANKRTDPTGLQPWYRRQAAVTVALLLTAAAAATVAWRVLPFAPIGAPDRTSTDLPIAFAIQPPDGVAWGDTPPEPQPAVSPNGRRLAFVGESPEGQGLWVRDLGETQAHLVPGSMEFGGPRSGLFWSSDSTRVGYCVRNRLKLHSFDGRPPDLLEASCTGGAGSWNQAGEILYRAKEGIFKISERGGPVARVTTLDSSREELRHDFPRWLPDGRRFIYTVIGPNREASGIFARTLDGSSVTRIVPDVSKSDYVAGADGASYLVFVRGSRLVAQRIDMATLAPLGEARVLAERMGIGNVAMPSFSASATLLVHRTGGTFRQSVWSWVDRQGRPSGARHVGRTGRVSTAALSPDGSILVYTPINPDLSNGGLWMVDFARRVEQPLFEPPPSVFLPAFSRNGRRIAFAAVEVGVRELYVMDFPGGRPARIATSPTLGLMAPEWSPDERSLIGTDNSDRIVAVRLDSPHDVMTLVPNGSQPRLSPDGRWMAYTSTVSGTPEVYVERFPGGGSRKRVSVQGGVQPQWRGDGSELFYIAPDGSLMALRVRTGGAVEDQEPTRLFREQLTSGGATPFDRAYLPTRDGQRFLLQVPTEGPVPLTAVRNWLTPAAPK